MRDIPIIFSGPMVRALLEGRKTMTRRLAWRPARKGEPTGEGSRLQYQGDGFVKEVTGHFRPSPWRNVKAGDRLWVRERLQYFGEPGGLASLMHEPLHWAADEREPGFVGPAIPVPDDWRLPKRVGEYIPSIHMPRWASRLTLIVTGSKVERLQDISEADATAEGMAYHDNGRNQYGQRAECWHHDPDQAALGSNFCLGSARHAFGNLWNSLHGADAWAENPEVVAISFEVIKANIDAPEAVAAEGERRCKVVIFVIGYRGTSSFTRGPMDSQWSKPTLSGTI